ncbi:MAG: PSD1 and planctomycete cytochrome C domain-containing protein [Planctomycetales bacterium]|jgi:hypothetical protein
MLSALRIPIDKGLPVLLAVCLAAASSSVSGAEQPSNERTLKNEAGIRFFESNIRSVLVKHCYECHSNQSGASEGGLRLDTRDAVRAGGDRGPAVVPGSPEKSILLTAVRHSDPDLKMPPQKRKLPESIIADLRAWIEMGAPDPRDEASEELAAVRKAGRDFWSYQTPTKPDVPRVDGDVWSRRDVDHFVLTKLRSSGLVPSSDADMPTLLRRLHFDLIGLPPTPAAIDKFIGRVNQEGVDNALTAEVDELLASPQFGERWGRHWLDVARFGESSGKDANISFPYAWRYRDYVIDCVNADVPYDRFLTEQLAGDLLPYESPQERARLLIATGFLAVGTKNLDAMNPVQFQADIVDEQIDTVTRAILGSSVACARCHDHKFDAFSMKDYYALAGIFASTKTYFGTFVSPANRVGGDPLPLPIEAGLPVYQKSIKPERVALLKADMAKLRQEGKGGRAAVFKAIKEGKDASGIFTLRDALRIFWRTGSIEGQLEKVDANGKALPLTMGVLDREKIVDVPVLKRGEITQPGDVVARAFPAVFGLNKKKPIPKDASGRLEFARWLTDPQHPRTSRVMVNRIWKYVFGEGLVKTVDDFGSTGQRPSHPKLLDYLALRFVENDWSVKSMVRELVLSRTYRQASTWREGAFVSDPDNRLLWRMPKRRLEAEAIRDAMLAVSGELDLSRPEASLVGRVIGDRPISLIGLDKRLPKDLDGSVHRSVYLPVIRDRLPDVLELFDFASASFVSGSRETTNVPTQALYLMNSPFVQERAAALAKRVRDEAGDDQRAAIQYVFRLCFGRKPTVDEEASALEFLTVDSKTESLIQFCQAILCTAEFRNID